MTNAREAESSHERLPYGWKSNWAAANRSVMHQDFGTEISGSPNVRSPCGLLDSENLAVERTFDSGEP